jgi:hypothetical protein
MTAVGGMTGIEIEIGTGMAAAAEMVGMTAVTGAALLVPVGEGAAMTAGAARVTGTGQLPQGTGTEAVTGAAACQTGTGSGSGTGQRQAAGMAAEAHGSTMGGANGSPLLKESECLSRSLLLHCAPFAWCCLVRACPHRWRTRLLSQALATLQASLPKRAAWVIVLITCPLCMCPCRPRGGEDEWEMTPTVASGRGGNQTGPSSGRATNTGGAGSRRAGDAKCSLPASHQLPPCASPQSNQK